MDSPVLTTSPSVGSSLRWPAAQVKMVRRGFQLLIAVAVLSVTAAANADYVVETLAVFEPPSVPEGIAVIVPTRRGHVLCGRHEPLVASRGDHGQGHGDGGMGGCQ